MLSESNFLRIHRSFIVALDKIRTYSARHMEVPGAELPIGRLFHERTEEVLRGRPPGRCKRSPRPFASNHGPEGPGIAKRHRHRTGRVIGLNAGEKRLSERAGPQEVPATSLEIRLLDVLQRPRPFQ
ncbi:LytTR family transcriptional regulator DNA-binding domain-containing protein [Hymenobacter humi]|uniref:LytTR family transcriptional regulator DNA-binding domain-containing protein n=1 Tax=Hymenobacter humi TaxID=1411620 RepID=A0ABW2U2S5_9BACT